MRGRKRPIYLYTATDGKRFKIGITIDPDTREKQLGARITNLWKRPYALELETSIRHMFAYCCVQGREWFDISEEEFLRIVHRTIRIQDDDTAIKRGLEPSKRPAPGAPPVIPDFELPWLAK